MKTRLREYAERLIERNDVRIEVSDRHVTVSWNEDHLIYGTKRVVSKDFSWFEIRAYRDKPEEKICFGLIARSHSGSTEVLDGGRDVEKLFEVKDMIDNLIDVVKAMVKPSEDVSMLAGQLQTAAERISKGKATLNQVREEFGLARVESESMDQLHVWAAKV